VAAPGGAAGRGGGGGGKRPRQFTRRERVFATSGAALLDAGDNDARDLPTLLALCLAAFPPLVRDVGWRPSAVAGLTPEDGQLARAMAIALNADTSPLAALDPADRPLVVTAYLEGGDAWVRQRERLSRWRSGTTFALVQSPGVADAADVVGTIRAVPGPETVLQAVAAALAAPVAEIPDIREATALAASTEAPWRRRQQVT